MDNKVFGLTFLAVLSSALLFFGVANAGSLAVDKWLFPTEEFGDNTYIGTTNVSNMEVASAKTLFTGQVASWKESAELLVTYQDATANYPLDNAEMLLDETVQNAESGSQNNFVFDLISSTTKSFLNSQFPAADFSDADIENITIKLERALASGQNQTRVNISDDSLSLNREVVSESTVEHNFENPGAAKVVEAMNEIQIAPNSQFSFLEFVENLNPTEVTDAELTEIASIIYSAVLKTNLLVDERSIGAVKPVSIPLGQEAAINRPLGIDFVFTNPNDSSFTLNLSKESNLLYASISSYPFVYDYTIGITEETDIEPRLIKQYSAFVASGNVVEEKGLSGKRLKVIRTVLENGEAVEVETVSADFYPPVHRVEVYPLTKTEAPAITVPVAGEPGFADANGDGIHDGTAVTPTVPAAEQPDFADTNGDGIHDGISAIPTMPAAEEEPVYDKGGNVITP